MPLAVNTTWSHYHLPTQITALPALPPLPLPHNRAKQKKNVATTNVTLRSIMLPLHACFGCTRLTVRSLPLCFFLFHSFARGQPKNNKLQDSIAARPYPHQCLVPAGSRQGCHPLQNSPPQPFYWFYFS